MVAPTYPVFINGDNTGVDGIACALCEVSGTENVIKILQTMLKLM
jgi:hypothetical protein